MLGIFLFDTSIGVSLDLNSQISDKRFYEVIDNNKVVITTYKGRFLVIQGFEQFNEGCDILKKCHMVIIFQLNNIYNCL